FGSLGLAAAAYNAGPQRVVKWLQRSSELPTETQLYILAITGRQAEEWRAGPAGERAFIERGNCLEVTADLGHIGVPRRWTDSAPAPLSPSPVPPDQLL